MSDQTSIFNKENSEATPPNKQSPESKVDDANPQDEVATLLGSIKNERGEPKYKTLKDALVGLANAQSYIPDLKSNLENKDKEIEQLRKEAERVAALEEAVQRLTEQRGSGDTPPKTLTAQEIAELVNQSLDNTLTKREQQNKQKENISIVVSSLKSAFGDTAETKYNEKAAELGVSVEEFNALAARSPKIVLTALGITEESRQQDNSLNPTKSSVNSNGFQGNPQSFIGRNPKTALVGAPAADVKSEQEASKKMVEELHKAGKSVHDLTDPKVYFKHFGQV